MERKSMKEMIQISRLSEDTPSLTMSLVQDLGYDVITEAGNIIVEGREPLDTKVNRYTRQLLHQLRSSTNKIPIKATTIPYEY